MIKKMILFSFFIVSTLINVASFKVGSLTCEFVKNPLGIDEKLPRLSWLIESNRNDVSQTAYELLVSDDPEEIDLLKGTVWDGYAIYSIPSGKYRFKTANN
jgi:hypothetical protein